jgi:Cdc6-like AAA superfamily ATPase
MAADELAEAQRALDGGHVPAELRGREKEVAEVRAFVAGCLQRGSGDSLYVCGSPGTGKTAAVQRALTQLRESSAAAVHFCYLNAMSVANGRAVVPALLSALCEAADLAPPPRWPVGDELDAIARRVFAGELDLRSALDLCAGVAKSPKSPKSPRAARRGIGSGSGGASRTMYVVTVDEIDRLLTAKSDTLLKLSAWPKMRDSRLVLVAVANRVDLYERFLGLLTRRQGPSAEPRTMVFQAYGVEQLVSIVQSRGGARLFEPEALRLCAMRVAKGSGDVRKCLDVCRECVSFAALNAEEDCGAAAPPAPPSPRRPRRGEPNEPRRTALQPRASLLRVPRVSVSMVAKVMSAALSSAHAKAMLALPKLQQSLLCAVALMGTDKSRVLRRDRLPAEYNRAASNFALPPIAGGVLSEMVDALEAQGLVALRGADRAKATLSIAVSVDDVRDAFEDSPLLGRIAKRLGVAAAASPPRV